MTNEDHYSNLERIAVAFRTFTQAIQVQEEDMNTMYCATAHRDALKRLDVKPTEFGCAATRLEDQRQLIAFALNGLGLMERFEGRL